tara:strand:- start:2580 stop:3356 length:777 start_codon:yes stop_codon:yes gene_type:complete
VLKKDKELIFFPIMAAFSVLALAFVFWSMGLIDIQEEQTSGTSFSDFIPEIILLFVANFFIVLFNSALISGALHRLRGGDPNVGSAMNHALKHIHHIFIWSIIVTIVAILIAIVKGDRREGSFVRQILGSMLQYGWTMMTFFVVPIIVAENMAPISAIKKSSSLFKQTWGDQVTANFGFGIIQILAIMISGAIGWFFGLLNPTLGIGIGVMFAAISVSVVYTLEGIYKAALYEFALGEKPLEFEQHDLSRAYTAKAVA